MSKNLVAVFDPKGVKHAKTTANASDLVKGAGWTWKPKAPVDLTNSAPYRNTERLDPASLAQSVIDNAGANASRVAKAVEIPEEEVVGDVDVNVFDISDAVITPAPADTDDAEPVAEIEDAPAPAKAARGRAKKGA